MKLLGIIGIALMVIGTSAQAQEVKNGPFTVTSPQFTVTATSCQALATKTLTNATQDTVWIKTKGGTTANKTRIYSSALKISGTTDSVVQTIYGVVDTGSVLPAMDWKVLYTDRTTNTAPVQVFDRAVSNEYAFIIIVTGRDGIAAQSTRWRRRIYFK